MPLSNEPVPPLPGAPASFATTHWSMVLAARERDSPAAQAALAELCRTYWYPLYAFIRRQGHSADLAQDLTQELFSRLLEKMRQQGKLQTFDRLKQFLMGEKNKVSHAQIAEELGMTEGAVQVAVRRLLRRYRDLLREEIARTVDEGEQVEDETRELFT